MIKCNVLKLTAFEFFKSFIVIFVESKLKTKSRG